MQSPAYADARPIAQSAFFKILRGEDPSDRRQWIELWQASPGKEPFAHPGYVDRFLESGGQSRCVVWQSPTGTAFLPLVLRPIERGGFDATTPYGYGGAFCWGQVDEEAFWDGVDAWAQTIGLVSLFARLSLFSEEILPFRGETCWATDNVVCSLDLEDEALLAGYEHKVRKNINKARRSGVQIDWDPAGERLGEFHKVYLGTMTRRDAGRGYFFPLSFFRELIANCPSQIAFVHAVVARRVISTEMILVGADTTYSYLGGTEQDSFDLRPNDLLKHEIIRWSRESGRKRFVLGGGHRPGDGIFRYKRSFAPEGVVPFFVGRRIFDAQACQELVRQRAQSEPGWTPDPDFFPPYRAPGLRPPAPDA